jgi:hypothetical protein
MEKKRESKYSWYAKRCNACCLNAAHPFRERACLLRLTAKGGGGRLLIAGIQCDITFLKRSIDRPKPSSIKKTYHCQKDQGDLQMQIPPWFKCT